ncbi:hypothetical protein Hypma_005324 [Hypsizygus marmoreus]|uniref:Dynamin N-terminal domain-containing protein n=1 Tax=Hypsizygus marmoreus TaxID=39966 RepID=A0A369K049_HYPMA|nr:hypothetical protein Hypma_005324 [Hypsizygus marmoreus]
MSSSYSTEDALQDIPKRVEKINQVIDATKAGARRTWKSNLEDCTKPPALTIAVLGGTGAGKSSLLHAILEADIVPTSGNRACTSVITKITYHDGPDHQADVHFISKDWERDLESYVADIRDEYEKKHKKKVTDEARKSWDALTAVYRTLTWKQLVESSNHEFLKDAEKWPSLKCLGTTKHITCDNLSTFSKEPALRLSRIIDWRDLLIYLALGTLMLRGVRWRRTSSKNYIRALRRVKNTIQIGYVSFLMKLSRGIDSISFQASKITFIVTKCDSLSYDEVVKSLQLDDEPEFVELREHLLQMREQTRIAHADEERAFSRRRDFEAVVVPSSAPRMVKAEPLDEMTGLKRLFPEEDESQPSKRPRTESDFGFGGTGAASSVDHEYSIFHELSQARAGLSSAREELESAEYAMKAYCSQRHSQETSEALLEKIMEELDDSFGDTAEAFSVFTVSTWDYQKLAGRTSGTPDCFLNAVDTCIPALQEYCHNLPRRARQEFAQSALVRMRKTAHSILQSFKDVKKDAADRKSLASNWGNGATSLESRLNKAYADQQKKTEQKLKKNFKEGLENVCTSATDLAIEEAIPTMDRLLQDMSWQRLRSVLRRQGRGQGTTWQVDFNDEFASPFLSTTLDSWRFTLDNKFFPSVSTDIKDMSRKLLDEVVASCELRKYPFFPSSHTFRHIGGLSLAQRVQFFSPSPRLSFSAWSSGFKQRAESQADSAIEEAVSALLVLHRRVKCQLDREQKNLSREITDVLRKRLTVGYQKTLAISGKGSVKQQREFLAEYIQNERKDIFKGLNTFVLQRLDNIAQSIGRSVGKGVTEVAEAVHDEMGLLWEQEPEQVENREEVRKTIKEICEELGRLTDLASKWTSD